MSPVGQDERWEKFQAFHDYLERAFPRVYQTLKLTKVNAYGLLYEWVGTDAELKPLLFMAHQGSSSDLLFKAPSFYSFLTMSSPFARLQMLYRSKRTRTRIGCTLLTPATVRHHVCPSSTVRIQLIVRVVILDDGTYIWGRGCIDDKSSLIGIMVRLECLATCVRTAS